MNALTDLPSLLKKPEKLNCRYWAAYANDIADKNRLQDNYNYSDATIESATAQLNEFIQDLMPSGCNLEIWFSDSPRPSKGGFRFRFFLNPNSGNTGSINASIGSMPIGSVSKEEAERIAEDKFKVFMDKFKQEQAIEDLRRHNLELQRKIKELTPTGLDRISERLLPYVPVIMDALNIKKVVSNSVNPQEQKNSNSNVNAEQQQKEAEEALTQLADGDPNFVSKLQKLAKLKKESPELYDFAVSKLG
ncbi:MAG: hypothetical protein HOO91_17815 [Bacteroidales bacterium]|nr:hypothetical protein [Bacteroidales bacterium]